MQREDSAVLFFPPLYFCGAPEQNRTVGFAVVARVSRTWCCDIRQEPMPEMFRLWRTGDEPGIESKPCRMGPVGQLVANCHRSVSYGVFIEC